VLQTKPGLLKKSTQPRPADVAIQINTLITDMVATIYRLAYTSAINEDGVEEEVLFGAALEPMFVSFYTTLATARGKSARVADIARRSGIPPTTVRRHLTALERTGRFKRVGREFKVDLDHIDSFFTTELVDDYIAMLERCLNQVQRLRAQLADRLKANSDAAAGRRRRPM
jgi:hypothetical protein